jgi:hypothetical protein
MVRDQNWQLTADLSDDASQPLKPSRKKGTDICRTRKEEKRTGRTRIRKTRPGERKSGKETHSRSARHHPERGRKRPAVNKGPEAAGNPAVPSG